MRIIAGRFKGTRLPSPKRKGLRPTSERVREAVFSTLGSTVVGCRVLELFAGTGAFGFEAISRGAASVVFVEEDGKSAETLARTTQSLRLHDEVRILNMDALDAVSQIHGRGSKFDIVFCDPPYSEEWIPRLLSAEQLLDLIEPGGLLILEGEARASHVEAPMNFETTFLRVYGDTRIQILQRR